MAQINNPSSAQAFQRRINEIRIENSDGRKFVPERELFDILRKDVVRDIVRKNSPVYQVEEIVEFVMRAARKVFAILVMVGAFSHLDHFIRSDQYRNRTTDDLLPLAKDTLLVILGDRYVAELFFERQWEFCVPVFSGRLMHRALERHTILPYLEESPMPSGSFGLISRIRIHPSHMSKSFNASTTFVKKEFEFDDTTYENEVRVLSTLQLLKNPNILQLAGCYTYKSKHNLITPYITGGTLRTLLTSPKPVGFTRERMICSLSGLACGLWALHELVLDSNAVSHKGHHQDLGLDNILIEGERFILADFGLSNIRKLSEASLTPFKGRRGYCQAPECVELGRPYQEHNATRATDIFSLGCIAADVVVFLVRGPEGIAEFRNAREFRMSPMCYYLFHKGDAANNAVITWLQDVAREEGSQSIADVVQLIAEMLQISPQARPSASSVMARLCISTFQAYSEHFEARFALFPSSIDAVIEHARFQSWQLSQDQELYSDSLGATQTGKNFDSTIQILRQFKECLDNIHPEHLDSKQQPFLELSILNTQLLNTLSTNRRNEASSYFDSILLSKLPSSPEQSAQASESIKPALGDSRVSQLAQIKHLVARVDDSSFSLSNFQACVVSDPVTVTGHIEKYKSAVIAERRTGRNRPVLVETIYYQDMYSRIKVLKRIDGLCHLLSDPHLSSQLGVLPFAGVVDHKDNFSFDLLYDFPKLPRLEMSSPPPPPPPQGNRPASLHELLVIGAQHETSPTDRPPWESRLQLAADLAQSLAAFHDVGWYHKDLTPFNVLFFPDRAPSRNVGTGASTTTTRFTTRRPYLIGFQHSHSATDDMTEGPVQDREHQRYHHPGYIDVQNHQFRRFRPCYDWYSLGIMLVEIGFWSPIDRLMQPLFASAAAAVVGSTMSTSPGTSASAISGGSNATRKIDNHKFSTTLLQQKVPQLAFCMGSRYADVVRECLTNLHQDDTGGDGEDIGITNSSPSDGGGSTNNGGSSSSSGGSNSNLLFRQKIVTPLKDFCAWHAPEVGRKRKREDD